MGLYKTFSESLRGRLGEHSPFPEVRGETTVGLRNGVKSDCSQVAQGNSGAPGGSEVYQSSIPAIISSFLDTGSGKMPLPLGVVTRCTCTEPQRLVI